MTRLEPLALHLQLLPDSIPVQHASTGPFQTPFLFFRRLQRCNARSRSSSHCPLRNGNPFTRMLKFLLGPSDPTFASCQRCPAGPEQVDILLADLGDGHFHDKR